MNEDQLLHHAHMQKARRRFVGMMIGSIVAALFLVYAALSLYYSSGTSQLDLSRPGFDAARQEVVRESEVFTGFSPDGPINEEVLNEFDELYREKAVEALKIDPFSAEALSDKTLLLD